MKHGIEGLLLIVLLIAQPIVASAGAQPPAREPSLLGPPEAQVQELTVRIGDSEVHYLESGPSQAPVLLLLHGGRFSSQTWRELGTINRFALSRVRVIAVDLPGFGRSPQTSLAADEFLARFIETVELDRPVVVSPSFSGRFSLPLVARRPELVGGFVPVAPAGIGTYIDELKGSKVPSLIVWGERDTSLPLSEASRLGAVFENSRTLVVAGAAHPCYLDEPELFHRELLEFVRQVSLPTPGG